jgi:hypothetical protein
MTISELNTKYNNGELPNFDSDKELRYKLVSPLFKNLYDNKVIYRERFIGIVQLEDIELTEDLFRATANGKLMIYKPSFIDYPIRKSWKFGCDWSALRLAENRLSSYSSWTIWPDPEFVQNIEKLMIDKKVKEVLGML